jgi:fumarate reductase subunit C
MYVYILNEAPTTGGNTKKYLGHMQNVCQFQPFYQFFMKRNTNIITLCKINVYLLSQFSQSQLDHEGM